MHEYSAIALGDLSSKKSIIIPVLIDNSSVPQYLARYVYVDLTIDVDSGIERIIDALSKKPLAKPSACPCPYKEITELVNVADRIFSYTTLTQAQPKNVTKKGNSLTTRIA